MTDIPPMKTCIIDLELLASLREAWMMFTMRGPLPVTIPLDDDGKALFRDYYGYMQGVKPHEMRPTVNVDGIKNGYRIIFDNASNTGQIIHRPSKGFHRHVRCTKARKRRVS